MEENIKRNDWDEIRHKNNLQWKWQWFRELYFLKYTRTKECPHSVLCKTRLGVCVWRVWSSFRVAVINLCQFRFCCLDFFPSQRLPFLFCQIRSRSCCKWAVLCRRLPIPSSGRCWKRLAVWYDGILATLPCLLPPCRIAKYSSMNFWRVHLSVATGRESRDRRVVSVLRGSCDAERTTLAATVECLVGDSIWPPH